MSLTLPFYACVLVGNIAVTGYEMEYDVSDYNSLPNLYLINILNVVGDTKQLVARQFIKTSKTHNDADFAEVIYEATVRCPALLPFLQGQVSFLPCRLTVTEGDDILSQDEMKRLFVKKWMEINSMGTA